MQQSFWIGAAPQADSIHRTGSIHLLVSGKVDIQR
jgi:hypothetical protein